jgi:SAM-dependent methyltransferase
MKEEAYKYEGDELKLFQHAKNWKNYFATYLKPYIKGDVLEAGAGIGATTALLNDGSADQWILLEPDEEMGEELRKKIHAKKLPLNSIYRKGVIQDLTEKFDTIIYIDVLEHIEKDAEELSTAKQLLKPGGYILVLSPAFQSLYNPFDKAIGHFRRYSKKQLKKITPPGLQLIKCAYFDSMGFFASALNKLFLRKKYPSQKQVLFWDRWIVPVSKVTDKILFHSFGKTIIAIWQFTGGHQAKNK